MEAIAKRLEVAMRQKTDADDMVKRLSAENSYVSAFNDTPYEMGL